MSKNDFTNNISARTNYASSRYTYVYEADTNRWRLAVTPPANKRPVIEVPFADLTVYEDSLLNYQFSANVFSDPDATDILTYTATLSTGAPLPTWLSFNPVTRRFYGTPLNEHVGVIKVKITATDDENLDVSDIFNITIINTNDSPTADNPIPDQQITEDSTVVARLPHNTFSDIDVGDILSYNFTLTNGNPTPSWFSFNSQTGTITASPLNGDVGSIEISVLATDIFGATAVDTFTIVVTNVNDAPTVNNSLTATKTATENQAFSYQFAADAFDDDDFIHGDIITYSTSTLPNWLSFNASTRTFSGTPLFNEVGTENVVVTATDLAGASVSTNFDINVEEQTVYPTVASTEYTYSTSNIDISDSGNVAIGFAYTTTYSDGDFGAEGFRGKPVNSYFDIATPNNFVWVDESEIPNSKTLDTALPGDRGVQSDFGRSTSGTTNEFIFTDMSGSGWAIRNHNLSGDDADNPDVDVYWKQFAFAEINFLASGSIDANDILVTNSQGLNVDLTHCQITNNGNNWKIIFWTSDPGTGNNFNVYNRL
tara:strand:+ start:826 stop:2448 length:1623 start_codon:yes stop_codon:yes gene_type:complete